MDDPDTARYVLGVNTGPHDAAAALLRDGEPVALLEQERLSGRRRAIGESPAGAIAACLAEGNIGLDAVTEIAIGWDVPALSEVEGAAFDEEEFATWLLEGIERRTRPPLRFIGHHEAHAACAFYTSGLKEAAILVVDGRGEAVATSIASGGPSGIEMLRTWGMDRSLGHLYGCAAAWAGLSIWGAGKLMGLAAYGKPGQPVPLAPSADGYDIEGAPADSPPAAQLKQLRIGLMNSFRRENFPFGPGDPSEPMAHADFAASIQHGLEEVLLHLAETAHRETGHASLAIAGGVALNCAANERLIRSGLFDEVWIPPVPHDAGVSLGAALAADRAGRGTPAPPARLPHALWAPSSDRPDAGAVEELLPEAELEEASPSQLPDLVAEHLQQGKLVGWWQGRAEVGQRALGARSILCNPRSRRSLVRANRVKGRESWRPLAPAVLADRTDGMFGGPLPAAADFMLTAWPVLESARAQAPAAVHVDGSARPQAVRPEQARYYETIDAFRERTGVPAVINTSFNLAGRPIVLSAEDAIDTFLQSELDVLVLEDLVVVKRGEKTDVAPAKKDPPEETKNFYLPWLQD